MRANSLTKIEPTQAAEDAFATQVNQMASFGIFMKAKSWMIGANVPGKRVESLFFPGGLPLYMTMCKESAENGYRGFILSGTDKISSGEEK